MRFPFPENGAPRLLYQGAANAVACDHVCVKNMNMLWFLITHTGSTDTDLTLALYEGTTATDSGRAITKVCPIWYDTDAGTTSDQMSRQTSAYNIVIDPATMNGFVGVMQVDPAILSDGYDWVYLSASGGNASNICTIHAIVDGQYHQQSPPTVIA